MNRRQILTCIGPAMLIVVAAAMGWEFGLKDAVLRADGGGALGHGGWFGVAAMVVAAALGIAVAAPSWARGSARLEHAAADARRSAERYREVVESQAELVCRYDADGKLSFVNDTFCRHFGARPGELLGRDFTKVINPVNLMDVVESLLEISAQQPVVTVVHELHGEGRGLRWQNWSHQGIFDADGQVVGYQSVGRDVTEPVRAQQHETQLSKLASLGTVIAGITHEINQPLNSIALAAENAVLALDSRRETEDGYFRDKFGIIHEQAMRMGEIINHLRSFTRSEPGHREALDARAILANVIKLARNQIQLDEIELAVEVPDICREVKGNRIELEQILLNLITNGRDAIMQRREQASTGNEAFTGRIAVAVADDSSKPYVTVTVSDNGGGIPARVLDRIFDPFVTTKRGSKGMGLGLSICYQSIVRMGGQINARNVGDGSEFEIVIPA